MTVKYTEILVPKVGLEPTRPCERGILNLRATLYLNDSLSSTVPSFLIFRPNVEYPIEG